jgi:hypothetical protein
MYQCAHTANATPEVTTTGINTVRHRRERHPIAPASVVAARIWTAVGNQPCINDIRAKWCRTDSASVSHAAAALTSVVEITPPS